MHFPLRPFMLAALLFGALAVTAQPSPTLQLALTTVATGLALPVDIAHATGDDRLFVVERRGRIRLVTPAGAVLPTPFLDITPRVLSSGGEQGLLGLAFHPDYAANGFFYVNYITDIGSAGTTRISRFRRLVGTADQADPASEVILYSVPQPFANHNGGSMLFGPDGYLYAALGDGGSGNDPGNRAQNLASAFGKVLRFDVNGGTAGGLPYGIPPTNPLVNTPGALPEIWLWGVRNPWRNSFDRANGDFWVADVGQSQWEEIDVMVDSVGANHNFGWRCYEGTHVAVGSGCQPASTYHAPVFEYPHDNATGGFSVTGGFVYRGQQSPALTGKYVCTDFVSGNFWTISRQGRIYTTALNTSLNRVHITCFGEDSAGEMYCAELQTGRLSRLTATGPTGVAGVAARPVVRLWPNPAAVTCRIDLPEAVAAEVELVSLLTGQVLRRTRAEASTAAATLDVRGLTGGLYGVRVYLPGRTITQQLVVAGE
ncbi:MAG: PQQ-dependent sugar dehydrogenase [Hymenobacteraceae bacterium]|nr:PQQ-dependent sugar dehydrogenase [Hymenobacteraceae bacterium]